MIEKTVQGPLMVLGFARPERRNAITAAMYAALADGLSAAKDDPAIRVVLLHGDPTAFTAGNDLGDFLENPPADESSPAHRFLEVLAGFDKPLLAAPCGQVVGVGATMLLHCDLIYAGDNARFSFPFVNLGLVPEAGSTWLLPRIAGWPKAAEKLLFGEPFDAAEALALGIVNQVLPAGEVLLFAKDRALALAARPLDALVQTKRLMREARGVNRLTGVMDGEMRVFRRLLAGPAAREAFTAFLQKRKPDFGAIDASPEGPAAGGKA